MTIPGNLILVVEIGVTHGPCGHWWAFTSLAPGVDSDWPGIEGEHRLTEEEAAADAYVMGKIFNDIVGPEGKVIPAFTIH